MMVTTSELKYVKDAIEAAKQQELARIALIKTNITQAQMMLQKILDSQCSHITSGTITK